LVADILIKFKSFCIIFSQLKISGLKLGLLIYFFRSVPKHKQIIHTTQTDRGFLQMSAIEVASLLGHPVGRQQKQQPDINVASMQLSKYTCSAGVL